LVFTCIDVRHSRHPFMLHFLSFSKLKGLHWKQDVCPDPAGGYGYMECSFSIRPISLVWVHQL